MSVITSEPKLFDEVRAILVEQYRQVKYTDGWTKEELRVAFDKYCAKNPKELKIVKKAYLFNLICQYAPIAPEVNDYFGHLGGVAECKKRDAEQNIGGDFDE